MDEEGIEPNGGFAALKKDLGRLVEVICDFAREQVRREE